jgi:hypothetical protein
MSAFFRNPFYCGLLVHTALEGQVIEGNHEKLISKEVFLEANDVLSENKQGYRTHPENEDIPLKRFYKCDECGKFLRAYKAYKNQKYYYKCNTKGCNCNMRADTLHDKFTGMLSQFSLEFDEGMQYLIKQQMIADYNKMNDQKADNVKNGEKQISEVSKKLERLEERYVLEEITKDMFDKFQSKFLEERKEIEKELTKFGKRVSNLEEYIDTAWGLADYNDRQTLQYLVFPDGIYYNRKKDECRTPKYNLTFSYFARLARVSGEKEKRELQYELHVPSLVACKVEISNFFLAEIEHFIAEISNAESYANKYRRE